jgi:hypothetical protein
LKTIIKFAVFMLRIENNTVGKSHTSGDVTMETTTCKCEFYKPNKKYCTIIQMCSR